MEWQRKVAKVFNRSFNEPFMPKGFCKAQLFEDSHGEKILNIQLGDREEEDESKVCRLSFLQGLGD